MNFLVRLDLPLPFAILLYSARNMISLNKKTIELNKMKICGINSFCRLNYSQKNFHSKYNRKMKVKNQKNKYREDLFF
ncbi:MAG: hypothetical protein BAJALOKI3v1_170060 [Promethearchaeota archaeon]|jgi:hypothetical protein|nr:MAG: hypothetical protein BAJALOKI3v1_170060 [Candidatus Lokiarchaeota archaeon]